MKCPFCGHLDTQVAETRVAEDGGFIRRRRRCGACGKRFTTYEKPEINFPVVVKKDGRRTEYAAAKLREQLTLKATVLREGQLQSIPVEQVVPGDVVQLSAGSLIPADGVLLEATDFYVNQAVLTGETFARYRVRRTAAPRAVTA